MAHPPVRCMQIRSSALDLKNIKIENNITIFNYTNNVCFSTKWQNNISQTVCLATKCFQNKSDLILLSLLGHVVLSLSSHRALLCVVMCIF